MEANKVKTLHVLDTVYTADSVEWCPVTGYQDILLCGTYQLQKSQDQQAQTSSEESNVKQTRLGRLYLYTVHCPADDPQLCLQTSKDMAGILDIKWCPSLYNGRPIFGLVTSDGQLRIYTVERIGGSVNVSMVYWTSVSDGECLGLSLDWSNRVDNSKVQVTCSSSDGCVCVYDVTSDGLNCVTSWKAHDYEAWITAFNYWDINIVYSGGDDCRLKGWDIRQDPKLPTFTSKRHSMGVCSIQSNPVKENILCTGSYDEQLLIWDTRQMKSPLTETALGGGIWRVKWQPKTTDHILTATMYNGFHIVDSKHLEGSNMDIVCHYREHDSLAYGADWCYLSQSQIRKTGHVDSCDVTETPSDSFSGDSNDKVDVHKLIATCSFYDHLLRLWDWCMV